MDKFIIITVENGEQFPLFAGANTNRYKIINGYLYRKNNFFFLKVGKIIGFN